MTIQFHCPKCGSLIAFADKHAGKHAKCVNCGEQFVIPSQSDQQPQTVKPDDGSDSPLPGFYHAVFVDNWKIFFDKDNLTAIVFVIAAVCFKFFAGGLCCLGILVYLGAWGYLFGLYLGVIYETAVGGDKFPEIEVGTSISFLWHIIKPLLVFTITLVFVEIPFFVTLALTRENGTSFEDMWQFTGLMDFVLILLFVVGLFIFPIAILKVAMIEDITSLFELRQFFVPVKKAFWPYLTVVVILVAACFIDANTRQYSPEAKESVLTIAGKLALNLAGQVAAIISMRSIGLFYRHYACFFSY